MRAVIQRVSKSELSIEGKEYSKIKEGLLILLGISQEDTKIEATVLAEKIIKLRIFEDENEKMNLSVQEIGGALHIVSQFTLYADCSHGNRPGFTDAANPEHANELYTYFIEECKRIGMPVATGSFGASMQINLINNGPVTILLECRKGKILKTFEI